MRILPTGKCFDNALDHLTELLKENPDRRWNGEYTLLHGILKLEDGTPYAHAWLETAEECLDFGIWDGDGVHKGSLCRFTVEKAEYYRERGVIECTRYSVQEVWKENRKYGTYGPWLQKYMDHTKNKKPLVHVADGVS